MILLGATVLLAAGLLFVKYKLEGLRAAVQAQAEARVGARLEVGGVLVNGLRGLRVDDFHLLSAPSDGPRIEMSIPHAYIFVNAVDLLYGAITIDRVQLERARIEVSRPANGAWFKEEWIRGLGMSQGGTSYLPGLSHALAFRVLGRECSVRVENVVGETSLELTELSFDFSRLVDSPDIRAKCSGLLGGSSEKRVQLDVRYSGMEDFDLRGHCARLTAEDVNVFLPGPQQFVTAGAASPDIRLAGYPNHTLILSLEAPFEGITVRDQPEMLKPATGALNALANYNTETHLLTLTTAQAAANQLGGRIEGSISFAGPLPQLDLRLQAEQLPVKEAISYLLHKEIDQFGAMNLELEEPYQVEVRLQGSTEHPTITAAADVHGGSLTFHPLDGRLPSADLRIGMLKLGWESGQPFPRGAINFADGVLTHKAYGMTARKIAGTLVMEQGQLTLDPLSAEITDNPLSGRAQLDLEKRKLEFSVSGTLTEMEKIPWSDSIKDLKIGGALTAQCSGTLTEKRYVIDATADLTRTRINFEWWFQKPEGIGSGIETAHLEMIPRKSIKLTGKAAVDLTPLSAALEFNYQNGKPRMQSVRIDAEPVDVVSAGKCINIPYTAQGGKGMKGYYEWKRVANTENGRISRVGGFFDDIAFLPLDVETPLRCKNVQIDALIDDSAATTKTGDITITAEEGYVPPLGVKWLLPLRPEEDEKRERAEKGDTSPPRTWTYRLAAKKLEMPPWKGSEFTGEAFNTPEESGLRAFGANIEGGTLDGRFIMRDADNLMTLSAQWKEIPAVYIIRHLKLPELLNGVMTGKVDYTMDQDDPGTLKGGGFFDIRDGQFSAETFLKEYGPQLRGSAFSLPPSLKYKRFKSSVEMQGDCIKTPDAVLDAQGISVHADGQFIIDGDMDYELKVAVSPETAAQIPILRDSFNIEGHRLTQNQIELGFRVKGPTFNPSGQVKGLPPMGVTLVSGAAELTSEALKVIDIPRQILFDLFKIGGGIVGAGK